MIVKDLKINGIKAPMGYALPFLSCSWKVTDTKAKRQERAVIEVSEKQDFSELVYKKEGNLSSMETILEMKPEPETTYYWRVKIEAENGETAVSESSTFETGKAEGDWKAKWIAADREDTFHPVFSKSFSAGKPIEKARLYICGLGVYEAYLNGEKTGDEYLAPYINDYRSGFQYQTFDVTGKLKKENEIQILLGKGWYMGRFGLEGKENLFGDRMCVIAELVITYTDGSREVAVTDETWKYRASHIIESGIYYGEDIDRCLRTDTKNPWKHAHVITAPGRLIERCSLPVKVMETLYPAAIIHTPAGETVLDFGQNHAGFMEFEADFEAGTKVSFACGEVLQQGNFYNENYREARSVFTYVSDGRKERVRPHFTYFGYRYLKVTGWPGEIKKEDIHSNVIYSEMERIGHIETSNEKINRLYENSVWGLKSNFIDLPTDCPQRNERLGWTGDAQVFAPTASWHMDTRAFYRSFLTNLRSEQKRMDGAVPNYIPSAGALGGTASVWGDAATLIPETLHRMYGSGADMELFYPMMRDWVAYMYRKDEADGGKRFFRCDFQFGDWLALDGVTEQSFKGSTDDAYIGTVYYCRSAQIVADMAKRLGKTEDYRIYKQLSEEIYQAILDEYVTPNGRLSVDTQAAYIIALKFGIYREKDTLIRQFKERLKKDCYQIRCGFVGAPLLCQTLCEHGMEDLAYHFLFNETYPGWLYCVDLGATTIWERWNSLLPDGSISGTGMNSLNHYAYGSVVEFFYQYLAGIRPLNPGFKRVLIAPVLDIRFRYMKCSYDSVSGKYRSEWEIHEDGTVSLTVEVPFDCEAEMHLPGTDKTKLLDAGTYTFTYMPDVDYRYAYSGKTRLLEVAGDQEVMEMLQRELPAAYQIIRNKDRENGNLTFEELKYLFFMGLNPEIVEPVIEKLCEVKRW